MWVLWDLKLVKTFFNQNTSLTLCLSFQLQIPTNPLQKELAWQIKIRCSRPVVKHFYDMDTKTKSAFLKLFLSIWTASLTVCCPGSSFSQTLSGSRWMMNLNMTLDRAGLFTGQIPWLPHQAINTGLLSYTIHTSFSPTVFFSMPCAKLR